MEVSVTTIENKSVEIAANLRFALDATQLKPKCPLWISFVKDSLQNGVDSTNYSHLKTPDEIILSSSQNGLKDCTSAIFSSSYPEPWLVQVTRDYPANENSETTWINHFVELVGQWNPDAVGFAFPKGLISKDFIINEMNTNPLVEKFNQLLIKLIYTLTHSSTVRHFYIYAKNQDTSVVLNYLLHLKNQLQKAKISSFVFH
jgi:hypothetical protein